MFDWRKVWWTYWPRTIDCNRVEALQKNVNRMFCIFFLDNDLKVLWRVMQMDTGRHQVVKIAFNVIRRVNRDDLLSQEITNYTKSNSFMFLERMGHWNLWFSPQWSRDHIMQDWSMIHRWTLWNYKSAGNFDDRLRGNSRWHCQYWGLLKLYFLNVFVSASPL